jgi:hypothetical protein
MVKAMLGDCVVQACGNVLCLHGKSLIRSGAGFVVAGWWHLSLHGARFRRVFGAAR